MTKTITLLQPTGQIHPAVGQLFKIMFSDSSIDHVYEETFLHQFEDYNCRNYPQLIGRELNVEKSYFNLG